MTTNKQSPLDAEPFVGYVKGLIDNGETNAGIVKCLAEGFEKDNLFYQLTTNERSIRRFRKRHDLSIPARSIASVTVEGDEAQIVTPVRPYPHMDDPDRMLRERGLDPEAWLIQGATINEWDGPQAGGSVVTYHQAKLQLKRKQPELAILSARSDGWVAPALKLKSNSSSQLIVVMGDQQAPFHDEQLHYLFCGWLEQNVPDRAVALGDKVDFPDISKYRLDPENCAYVNDCIQAGYNIFRDYRQASLNTEWDFLPGNHDERLRNIVLDRVPSLYGVKRANTDDGDGEAAMAIPHLLRLDELGINYHDPRGPYDLAQINLSHKLAVRHGWIARKGSGVSALATLEHLGYSVIVGHTHRQGIVYKTTHDINGETSTLTAAEAGCMCRINNERVGGRRFPNFMPNPNWQQGFSTITLHSDGMFRIDNATYVNGTLLWRDECLR